MARDRVAAGLPVAALIFNSLVWGTSWWPFRALEARGLHPLWATALIYLLAVGAIVITHRHAVLQLLRAPALWVLVLAAGTTNAAFNWGVTIGDVVRVVLLFYLMPIWSLGLAWLLLDEAPTGIALLRLVLAVAGAGIVLWPADAVGWNLLPRSLPDLLGLLGGFSFALNNVMLRREAGRSSEARALAMFFGGAAVASAVAGALTLAGSVPALPAPAPGWIGIALVMAVLFLLGNLALQFGAARLSAGATAVVMLTEVVFASGSALALGAGRLSGPLLLGGGLILMAALLSALEPGPGH
jgi:drug/metabolite transporter (DMT)-like permease